MFTDYHQNSRIQRLDGAILDCSMDHQSLLRLLRGRVCRLLSLFGHLARQRRDSFKRALLVFL